MTAERQRELSEMSDAWIREMLEIRTNEINELAGELARRHPEEKGQKK